MNNNKPSQQHAATPKRHQARSVANIAHLEMLWVRLKVKVKCSELMGPGLHLLEEEEVNAHSCIKQQWWQEDVQEELVWLYAKPPGN